MKQEVFLYIFMVFSLTVASEEGTLTTVGNDVLLYTIQIK